MTSPIGAGDWAAQIVGRGGSPVLHELAWNSLSCSRTLNSTSQASVGIPNSAPSLSGACEVIRDSEPWATELVLYRDSVLAWCGPIINITASLSGGSISAQDLFHWTEQRFMLDFYSDGDAGDVFKAIFLKAMEPDTSPNVQISARGSGIQTSQNFKEQEFHRAADALRSLARFGVDFTTIGRQVLAGGQEVFLSSDPLILHDDGVLQAEIVKEGENLATDVAVFGATLDQGRNPVNGRAIGGDQTYGLIQKSFTELLLRDRVSADANALARLQSMQPAPLRVNVTFSPQAPFEFEQLIPGRQLDTRLSIAAGCGSVLDILRLQQVDVSASRGSDGSTEQVTGQLIPLGVGNDDA